MATTFVVETLEDAVKAGIIGAGTGGAGDITGIVHASAAPVAPLIGFVVAFIGSVLLSLLSKPIGNPATNHIINSVTSGEIDSLAAVVAAVAGSVALPATPAPIVAQPGAQSLPQPVAPAPPAAPVA